MTRHAKVADAPIDLSRRWNHNTHYRRIVLDALHSGARTALDVGAAMDSLPRSCASRSLFTGK